MPAFRTAIAALALLCASTAAAQDAPPRADNPLIDYAGFVALAAKLGEVREAHRLSWEEFAARAGEDGTIVLDTRSASAFHMGHIEGAVNLPFSDFTAEKLAQVLGTDKSRAILIYCNNNFSDNVASVMTKKVELALNIPTFINLHGYGYTNIWELADVMSIADARIGWVADPEIQAGQ